MSDLYCRTDVQMARVDDRRVLNGIVFVNRNGLWWCDAPKDYSLHKTL